MFRVILVERKDCRTIIWAEFISTSGSNFKTSNKWKNLYFFSDMTKRTRPLPYESSTSKTSQKTTKRFSYEKYLFDRFINFFHFTDRNGLQNVHLHLFGECPNLIIFSKNYFFLSKNCFECLIKSNNPFLKNNLLLPQYY